MLTAEGQLRTNECRTWVEEEEEVEKVSQWARLYLRAAGAKPKFSRCCVTVREEGAPSVQTQ
jgi:hypothetical protein